MNITSYIFKSTSKTHFKFTGDDCASNVSRLCRKAKNPISRDLLELLMGPKNQRKITTAAVCVYPAMVPYAKKTIDEIGVKLPIASGIKSQFFFKHPSA
jgi:deoxyribose-phosphate aldolase